MHAGFSMYSSDDVLVSISWEIVPWVCIASDILSGWGHTISLVKLGQNIEPQINCINSFLVCLSPKKHRGKT